MQEENTKANDEVLTMKENLIQLVDTIQNEDKIDLKETPIIFKWIYPEKKEILFQLMVQEIDPEDVILDEDDDPIQSEIVTDKTTIH